MRAEMSEVLPRNQPRGAIPASPRVDEDSGTDHAGATAEHRGRLGSRGRQGAREDVRIIKSGGKG